MGPKVLRRVSLGVPTHEGVAIIFDDDDSIQAWKESSVLLHNVVKPEDLDDPISIAEHLLVASCSHSIPRLRQTHS
ncbi:hypothetical protein BGY98DRAFT_1023607 [Russula aff. rugulosa BPL654]|nr:hypothetical protein BGY98DRAFT_1023607 [Russula aff. rugulosa BPL654]